MQDLEEKEEQEQGSSIMGCIRFVMDKGEGSNFEWLSESTTPEREEGGKRLVNHGMHAFH